MAFNKTNNNTTKNQFVASITSDNTGKTVMWLNPTDSFITAVLGKELKEVTAEEIKEKLLAVLTSPDFSLTIKDITAEMVLIPVTEF